MLDVEIRKLLTANTSIEKHRDNKFGCTMEQLDDTYEVVLSICGDVIDLNQTNTSFVSLFIREDELSHQKIGSKVDPLFEWEDSAEE